jgi:riboflavin synthase
MMFTGIIKEKGIISSIIDMGQDREFTVKAGVLPGSIKLGDSISVNGVCLTVKRFDPDSFSFDVSSNSLKYSNLGSLKKGDPVNLEESLSPDSKMGGHFVSGHVDAVAAITGIVETGKSFEVTFTLEESIAQFIAARGSVAIDGISLTVTEVSGGSFKTVIIPHTYENTTLGGKGIGSTVNVEVDMLARYIVNYLSRRKQGEDFIEKDRILKEKLEKNGFIQ